MRVRPDSWRRALLMLALGIGPATAPAVRGETAGEQQLQQAQALHQGEQWSEALTAWVALIEGFPKHPSVNDGTAHCQAASCHRRLGSPERAVEVLESYLEAYPRGTGGGHVWRLLFEIRVEQGDDPAARDAGGRVLALAPGSSHAFEVLRTYIQRGWEVPRLATTYATLHDWAFEKVDGRREPELRLGLLDLIQRAHRKEKLVKEGGILFCQAWCHQQAGRPEQAVQLGERYLKRFPKGDSAPQTRLLVATCALELSPPDTRRARKALAPLTRDEGARYHGEARRLVRIAGTGGPTVQLPAGQGCPREEGLGKVALLTNLPSSDARLEALSGWIAAREAEVVRFRGSDPLVAGEDLARLGVEYVALAVPPADVDSNFQYAMLELCRDLDADPMPDFHFGYLSARNPADLRAFVTRILEKEGAGGTRARQVDIDAPPDSLADPDFLIHFGHGNPWSVIDGWTAEQIAGMDLPGRPVVFSGACFNGVLSRSYHTSQTLPSCVPPAEIDPDRLLSLAWVHAGATGLLAALDGDRGEMALAEWSFFRSRAPRLGEVIGHQYRLAFTSLPETFPGFPRLQVGHTKSMSFHSVMLRGMVSRILISDPMYRPLHQPLTDPTTRLEVTLDEDAGTVAVEVELLRAESGPFINYLPRPPSDRFDGRLYGRAELPETLAGRLSEPEVSVQANGAELTLTRAHARHEVWGGKRYVNVQAETPDRRLVTPGTKARFVFRRQR